ncbi:hypothetical protein AGMMS50239_15960 [Bacteroidia bacterium]|nr:hypothetical protein AGMMS50239_15960 [Bacteroidia bacterium]
MDERKKLVKEWGEDTAYAAKSHFKSADLKKNSIYILVVVNILFAIFSILQLDILPPELFRLFGIISLVASIFVLIHESQEGKDSVKKHMECGEKYLSLHKTLHSLYRRSAAILESEINDVKGKLDELTNAEKPIISQIAKALAERAIEKKGEMNTWWKDADN